MNPNLARHTTTARHHLETLGTKSEDESSKWLSYIVQEVWPYAAQIATFIVQEYIQPALDSAMPAGIPAPRFTRINIGNDPLRIESVSVYERRYSASDICPVLEADIVYEGKPQIEMSYAGIVFGVQDAKVKGRVEVLFRPLINRIPLIGAVQVAFINRPQIDYKLTGLAALGDQSLIRGTVKSVVEDVFASVAVLPHRVAGKLAPDTDYLHFVAKPLGVLRVAAISGMGFPCTDRNAFKQAIGQSELPDVYLRIRHGSKSYDTKPVNSSSEPEWQDQIFDFVLTTESPSQELQIEAYDSDIGQDDFLGRAFVLVKDIVNTGVHSIELRDSPEDAKPVVRIAAKWLPLSTNLRQAQDALLARREDKKHRLNCSSLLLTVDIDEAKNLPPKRRPYVRLRIGKHEYHTSAAYEMPGIFSVEHPDFEQSFHVLLDGSLEANERIQYDVLDFYSGSELGHAFSSLAEAIQAGAEGKVYNFPLIDAKRADASLRLRVQLAAVIDQPPLWEELADPGSSLYNRRY